jgi:hypothetical protein
MLITTISCVRRKARINRTRMDRTEIIPWLPVVSVQGCGLDGCIVASLPVPKAALSQIRTVWWNHNDLLQFSSVSRHWKSSGSGSDFSSLKFIFTKSCLFNVTVEAALFPESWPIFFDFFDFCIPFYV